MKLIQNGKPTDTDCLVKCLKLKLEAKVMLTVNVDVQDSLINVLNGGCKTPSSPSKSLRTRFTSYT